MRFSRRALALALAYALSVHPVAAQIQAVRLAAPSGVTVGAAAASAAGSSSAGTVRLQALALPLAMSFAAAPSASLPAAASPAAAAAAATSAAAVLPAAALPAATAAALPADQRVAAIRVAADKAVDGIGRASSSEASGRAAVQFSTLTGDGPIASVSGTDAVAPAGRALADVPAAPQLSPASRAAETVKPAEPPAPTPKPGLLSVFRDPARNHAFWRYFFGSSIFLLGYEMYAVGKPYLISAWTTNSLNEHKDPRAGSAQAVKELIRSNRALTSIAHWLAQALSYFMIPIFTEDARKDGPRKWLVRSVMIRAAVLAAVPALFFATGLLSVQASFGVLVALTAAQSFFQGVSVTTEAEATTSLFGDKSVTDEERNKANSILTVAGSVIAILGPLAAGLLARIGPVMHKTGVSGAVIFGIYSGAAALASLIYAGIKMFGAQDRTAAVAVAAGGAPAESRTLGGTLLMLWRSIVDGTRIVLKDRLLRTMTALSMFGALFEDPLVSNVLPDYVENLAAQSPGAVAAVSHIPVFGWVVKTLMATSMGHFSLMMLMGSVGGIAAVLLMKPLSRLFRKLGFKTEEGLTVPFYFIAALEAPLFLLMIHTPTLLGVVALYGLQSLAIGFIGITVSGLQQQNLGGQKKEDVNKILAATSLLGIAVAALSTYAYGFLLKDITVALSMKIAALATGGVCLLRLAAPFLSFTKAQRQPPAPAAGVSAEPARATGFRPSLGDRSGHSSARSLRF